MRPLQENCTLPSQIRLKQCPGPDKELAWQLTSDPLPTINEGQVRVNIDYISVDPGMMGWIAAKKSYMPPINEGDVMRAFGVGQIVESKRDSLPVGSFVTGFTGVQSEAILSEEALLRIVDETSAPVRHYLSILGMPAFTGYFGMNDIGRPKAGETVLISGCAGAVGSIASQIAKLSGARVVGIAGGEKKCALLTETYGLDAAIDYKAGPIWQQVKDLCPAGVDVYFDNVGGETLDIALAKMNYMGRVVLCGAISQYSGGMGAAQGPRNYLQLIAKSLRMQGFTMKDYMHRIPEATESLSKLIADEKISFKEHVLEGIDSFPEAFKMIFAGENFGKLMLKV